MVEMRLKLWPVEWEFPWKSSRWRVLGAGWQAGGNPGKPKPNPGGLLHSRDDAGNGGRTESIRESTLYGLTGSDWKSWVYIVSRWGYGQVNSVTHYCSWLSLLQSAEFRLLRRCREQRHRRKTGGRDRWQADTETWRKKEKQKGGGDRLEQGS